MRFHFSTINHNATGRSTLGDMFDWFSAGLMELGHQVTTGEDIDPECWNVLWDNFRPGMGAALRDAGIKYGIVATEIPDTEGGFNWRSDDPWPRRFAAFPEVAQGASFIWSMIKSACDHYKNFAPCVFMELGYSARLIPDRAIIDVEPAFEFGFFGLRTPHRETVYAELSKHCRVVWPDHLPSSAEIIEFISSTKVGLNFRQSENWPIPSPTRLGRYLHGQRVLASERTTVPTRQGDLIKMAPPGVDFLDWCLACATLDWRREAARAFERYRNEMPMKLIMENALDAALPRLRTASHPGGQRFAPPDLHVHDPG